MTIDFSRDEITRLLARVPVTDAELQRKLRAALNESQAITVADLKMILDPAWERHHKRGRHVYQVVIQTIIGKSDLIDWRKFRTNHPLFCAYWDRADWRFCPETLLDWIDNGCCAPPPEAAREAPNTRTARIGNRQR